MSWFRLFFPFAGAYFLSYHFRTINAVVGPILSSELSLGAADLGDYPLSAEERARVALMTVKAARRECASVIEAAQAYPLGAPLAPPLRPVRRAQR